MIARFFVLLVAVAMLAGCVHQPRSDSGPVTVSAGERVELGWRVVSRGTEPLRIVPVTRKTPATADEIADIEAKVAEIDAALRNQKP